MRSYESIKTRKKLNAIQEKAYKRHVYIYNIYIHIYDIYIYIIYIYIYNTSVKNISELEI